MRRPPRFSEVIHTKAFDATAPDVLTEDEIAQLEFTIAENPDAGDVIPGTGGVRKIRVAAKGHGKSRGARVIYFFLPSREELYLLAAYFKGRRENLTADDKKEFKQFTERLKRGAE